MAQTLTQFIQKFQAKINGLDIFVSDTLGDIVAKEAVQKVTKRVVSTGTDSKGSSFSGYNSKSHLKKRRAKGLGSKKNFSFTGGMMKSYKKVDEKKIPDGFQVILDVTGTNADGDRAKKRNKPNSFIADVHSKREGINILDISDSELKEIEDKIGVQLEKYLNVT